MKAQNKMKPRIFYNKKLELWCCAYKNRQYPQPFMLEVGFTPLDAYQNWIKLYGTNQEVVIDNRHR